MTILGAGVFANILLTIIFAIILTVFFSLAYAPSGVIFNDYSYTIAPISSVAGASIINETLNVGGLNFTKIKIENNSYYVSSEFFKLNLTEISKDTPTKLYNDFPAIKTGMKSPIVEINGKAVTSLMDIRKEIDRYNPGQTITISTKNKNKTGTYISDYQIKLVSDPNNSSRAILGIATVQQKQTLFKTLMSKMMGASKDPNIYYEPKIDGDLTEFFYNLLLWLVMINFGVALANMWPVAIFDGGYFFYLIVLSITKNKKIAEKSLKISTALFLGAIALLMIFWAVGMFWKF
jgi:membrane-associated protease RseP (regulator of RpoE activity)